MATVAAYTLRDLQRIQTENARTEFNLLPELPKPPDTTKATGLKFGMRVEWSQVTGVDGYRVAVMTNNNLAAPDKLSPLLEGETTLEWVFFTGDVAIARQFTVQSFKRSVNGEILFSDFTRPFRSATSKIDGGAADSAPAASPSAPVAPRTESTPGDPGGVSPTRIATT